jgi:beta-glucanase (GH16 family)
MCSRFKPGSILLMLFLLPLLAIATYSCKKSQAEPVLNLTGTTYTTYEDIPSGSISVPVVLSAVYDKTVTVNWETADSTGIALTDYMSASGTVTFQPGQKIKNISLLVFPDTAKKQDVDFKIVFSEPVNCSLKGSFTSVKILNTDYATLVWDEEFNSGPLSTSDWNYELGAGGWGNAELETYTNSIENAHIDTGYLHITAIKGTSPLYSSARLTTKGKKEFTHCRAEIRAKLPEGKGIWPAIWMLGANISSVSWPACGEIDIMELLGDNPATSYGTVHWNDNGHQSRGSQKSLNTGKFSSSFHTFSITWGPNHFEWRIDNDPFLYVSKSEIPAFPFDQPQFFILNVAVGGNWPGSPNETTVFPQNMIIDYIRVYQ